MNPKIIDLDQQKPEGDWIGWKAWMELAGSQHVGTDVAQFAVAARAARDAGLAFALELVREPENQHDRKAIAALGRVGGQTWRLGYLPRDEARELAAFPSAMPLSGRIISVKFLGDSVYVKVQVLLPSKKWRIAQGWEPKAKQP